MRRSLIILVLAAVLVGGLFVGQATALTVTGGTDAQNAYARQVIESCWLDWQIVDQEVDGVDVVFEEHHDPYWYTLQSVYGLAWPGNISIRDELVPGPSLGEVTSHEWCHQIWFVMPYATRQEWVALCTDGIGSYDPKLWASSPAENFAECLRVALFPVDYMVNRQPRTILNRLSLEDTRAFVSLWRWGLDCPFPDLANEDPELRAATGYLVAKGIIQGYPDGTCGPYAPLLRRHVALICQRAGLPAPDWFDDYTPALRADVRDAIPGLTWLEDRWSEGITRGQLIRLIWRSR